jgi:hypothetical protein
MRRPAPFLLLLGLSACATLGPGPTLRLDGSLEVAEYGGTGPGLHRASTRDAYWFGVANDTHSVANLYLELGDELHVLHASGSLGRAVYRRDGDVWQLVSGFTWIARDPAIRKDGGGDTAALAERAALYQRQRWMGATFRQGRDRETELVVARDYPGLDRARMAASWLAGPGEQERAATWPEGAAISEGVLALTRGETPARLEFDTRGWQSVTQATAGGFQD